VNGETGHRFFGSVSITLDELRCAPVAGTIWGRR
jgi:hypothetical protein